ncbi:MAG: glycine--tRNA ligase [Bacteroidetes bacterium]|nr:glycine--tRNA ligase [Bacteroidota bacterium]
MALTDVMEKLVSLSKRRGFVFQSSEIYGGLNSCWDYGPLGIELKRNVKDAWWNAMTRHHDDIEGIDASILMHPTVWKASGHVDGFTDPLVDCKQCKSRFRADKIDLTKPCAVCGTRDSFTEPRLFNLMFKTFMGPVEEDASVVYLRPETAQGIYVNFHNVKEASRQKVPFGIAQIGKAFRNEITPGNFIFRTREFEQMEMQFFIQPGTENEWMQKWREERFQWYLDLGIRKEKLRFHQHGPNELAHYASDAYDIEYEFPFGWNELEGIHSRTDFDLKNHQEFSGKNLLYYDQERNEKYIPYIVETSAGCDRSVLTFLVDAYDEDMMGDEQRTVLRFHPKIAPLKAAFLPLVKKDGIADIADNLYRDIQKHFKVFYDDSGAIGRRYRRMDEAGTPFCFTIDYQTKEDQTVTVRHRDTGAQERIAMDSVRRFMDEKINQ